LLVRGLIWKGCNNIRAISFVDFGPCVQHMGWRRICVNAKWILSFLLRFVNIVLFHIMTCKWIWDSVYSSTDIAVWIKAFIIFRLYYRGSADASGDHPASYPKSIVDKTVGRRGW